MVDKPENDKDNNDESISDKDIEYMIDLIGLSLNGENLEKINSLKSNALSLLIRTYFISSPIFHHPPSFHFIPPITTNTTLKIS